MDFFYSTVSNCLDHCYSHNMEYFKLNQEFKMPQSFPLCDISNSTSSHSDNPFVKVFTATEEYGSQHSTNIEPTLTMINTGCLSFLDEIESEHDILSVDTIHNCDSGLHITLLVNKSVRSWEEEQVTLWAAFVSSKHKFPIVSKHVTKFCNINGEKLCNMTLQDFVEIFSDESIARKYYDELQIFISNNSVSDNKLEDKVLHALDNVSLDNLRVPFEYMMETNYDESDNDSCGKVCGNVTDSGVESCDESGSDPEMLLNAKHKQINCPSTVRVDDGYKLKDLVTDLFSGFDAGENENQYQFLKDSEINTANEVQMKMPNNSIQKNEKLVKRSVGRPRGSKKPPKEKKIGKLWENIKEWLYDPQYNPSIICWENYNTGIFRFVDSAKAAQLWGVIKNNPDMTFEKMTRAMRYHYKNKVLKSVDKKLLYQFGEKAHGWHKANPILLNQKKF